jgi:3-hydroxyacyl-CoA dehydrogenase/enoyl-CoA hydratase/3-hydroxybutyryl-CoA epimerase
VAVSLQAKNLISVYFLNEELKKAYKVPEGLLAGPEGSDIKLAGLLGAGNMGGGIAWLFSNSDIRVRMKDISWQYVAAGLKAIRDIYDELEKKHKIEGREAGLKIHKVSGTIDYSGFQNADVVIEAITEDRDAKIKMLKELENYVRADSVIATNTSSFSIRELSGELMHPERFLGFHFFNPVNRMPLIEVIRGEKTSDQSLYKMINLARMLKKIPVLVNDSNGFLVNRVLMSYLMEAVIMMEEGVDFTRIDSSIYNYGMPMGPFALMDEIGIKTAVKVAAILEKAYPERSVKSKLMPEFVKNSSLTGRSAGSGFYIYKKKMKFPNPAVRIILKNNGINRINISGDEITERCILRMINEAAYCIGEKIIESPGHLDMALILGTGFPPFRGGLLRSADETGIRRICEKLREYEARFGVRYKTAPLLQEMNEKKGRFYK